MDTIFLLASTSVSLWSIVRVGHYKRKCEEALDGWRNANNRSERLIGMLEKAQDQIGKIEPFAKPDVATKRFEYSLN
jgi:hypothetical protein